MSDEFCCVHRDVRLTGIAGLKPFITARRASLLQQLSAFGCTVLATSDATFQRYSVFPNPFNDVILVKNEENRAVSWQLCDVAGKSILSGAGRGNMEILTRSIPAGVYWLTIATPGSTGSAVLKLVKSVD